MFLKNKIITIITRILLVLLALYLGHSFLIYLVFSFETLFSAWVIPVTLGYLYLIINLARMKKIALIIFSVNFFLSFCISIYLTFSLGELNIFFGISNWLPVVFFWVSLIILPVFGISALVRKLIKKS